MKPTSRTIWILGVCLFIGGVALTVFGEKGLWDLRRLQHEYTRLEAENQRLIKENRDLYNEVDRLNHDPKYIEAIARKELGLIGKEEIILRSQ